MNDILIRRICHDLITPFNAISLGVDMLEISSESSFDPSILSNIRESVDKANAILMFYRALFSDNSGNFSNISLAKQMNEYLNKYNITAKLISDVENIGPIPGKIAMYATAIAKEMLQTGGSVEITFSHSHILIQYFGEKISSQLFNFENAPSHKNIIQYLANEFIKANHYEMTTSQDVSRIIIDITRCE